MAHSAELPDHTYHKNGLENPARKLLQHRFQFHHPDSKAFHEDGFDACIA